MKYKMLCTDLDGTFLNKRGLVESDSLKAIEKVAKAGIEFVVVTGRVFAGIPTEILECPYVRYIICSNGACIYDKKSGKTLNQYLSHDSLEKIKSVLSEFDHILCAHDNGREHIDATNYENRKLYHINEMFEYYFSIVGDLDENFPIWFSDSDLKIEMLTAFFKNSEDRLNCAERLSQIDDVYVTSSFPQNIEFFSSKATKGEAVKKLAEILGIETNEIIAIGDSDNDVPMLEFSALGLAVSNANERAKAAADYIICSNEENSLLYTYVNFIETEELK